MSLDILSNIVRCRFTIYFYITTTMYSVSKFVVITQDFQLSNFKDFAL